MMHDLMHSLPAFSVALRHTRPFGKWISSASMTPVHLPLGPSPALARRTSHKRRGAGTWALEAGSHEMRLAWHFIHPHCFLLNSLFYIESESCSVVSDSLPPHTVHGTLQARILEWAAFPFSRGSSQPRDGTQVFRLAGGFFTSWATREGDFVRTCNRGQRCAGSRRTAEGLSHTRTCLPSPPDSLPI